jgi:magnesium-transporting ATPase (P-type)
VSFLLGTNCGEVLYLGFSIAVGLPVPLLALQIIFLNLMSDGCPAVALSREPAEDSIMKVKPRSKKENIMTKHWWMYGNLPHVFFEACAVICSLAAGLYIYTGAVYRTDIQDLCYNYDTPASAHEETSIVGQLSFFQPEAGATIPLPVVCVCHRYDFYAQDWTTLGNWYDPRAGKMVDWEAKSWLDTAEVAQGWAAGGMNGQTNTFSATTMQEVAEALYGDSTSAGLIGKETDVMLDLAHMHHEYKYAENVCSSYGTTLGRTQTFVSAVYCEMLRAYTVRCAPGDGSDPPWAWTVFNRNFTLHIACQISFWMTIAVTIIPWLNKNAFHAQPLTFPGYVVACFFPVVNIIMDEIVPKPLYKMIVVAGRKNEKAGEATNGKQNGGQEESKAVSL